MIPQGPGAPTGPDSLRAVLDKVFAGPAYEWVEPKNPLDFLLRWWRDFLRWLSGLEQARPLFYWALIWILTAILAAIVVHAVYVMVQTLKAAGAPAGASDLPLSPEVRGAGWYRREAQRLAREGRYAEAMQADFLGLVLELDQRGTLKFHPSKTPYEYSTEVRGEEPVRSAFRGLVRSLYGYAFARAPCGPDDFVRWLDASRAERYAASH
jgi:uncharacterized protein DUF4129